MGGSESPADFGNPQVAALPAHLKKFIVDQRYDMYTPVDHALWRYVMRQNFSYLKGAAYYPYIPGLRMAGLTIEKIPSLQEMNDALGKIGWGAVTVDGFIPPAAFMEFQARCVLVIAADIRKLEHIEYTSAPDIIHESAGHAPIISDTKYNQYLSYLGFIGTKALFSARDYELYEAIRQLSLLKELPDASENEVKIAEEKVLFLQKNMGEPSEMALLSRLQWWSVEYGLIGSPDNPKIYGAGLLSSIGESSWCMRPEVKKLPYTIDAINYAYDITQPQPQLFVTPTFENLIDVLKKFEDQMAWRKGGAGSILKAIASRNICTAELDSGVQVTGVFSELKTDSEDNILIFGTSGPSAVCTGDKVVEHLGPSALPNGFITVIGKFKGQTELPYLITTDHLASIGLTAGKICRIEMENGVLIEGYFRSAVYQHGKLLLLNFNNSKISHVDGLIEPRCFDFFTLAPATSVVSVFNGAADKTIFEEDLYVSGERTRKAKYSDRDTKYQKIFREIREIREEKTELQKLEFILNQLDQNFPEDWLCTLEIAELLHGNSEMINLDKKVRDRLSLLSNSKPDLKKLIRDGLSIVDQGLVVE
ncbi:MAG: aromatic amino acid hydroxylase [Cyclobacteriaceae bacterium]